ncbi:hypothetical protein HDU79_002105 [Rhizoclosmatium sp. JEL0117]|nr:hypothetical protein HDU79_002105 [Rhizoclosmatium sp. JEL0117]
MKLQVHLASLFLVLIQISSATPTMQDPTIIIPPTIPAAKLLQPLQRSLADRYHALDDTSNYLESLLSIFQSWAPLNVVGCVGNPCSNLRDPSDATVSFSQIYFRKGNENATIYWVYANRGYEWGVGKGASREWGYTKGAILAEGGDFVSFVEI